MGKITSIYLTDEEATNLKKFCEENQCTQYSALKTALKELLSKHIKENNREISLQGTTSQKISSDPEKSTLTDYDKKPLKWLQKLAKDLRAQKASKQL